MNNQLDTTMHERAAIARDIAKRFNIITKSVDDVITKLILENISQSEANYTAEDKLKITQKHGEIGEIKENELFDKRSDLHE